MNCKYCGSEISDNAKFCKVCGKKTEPEDIPGEEIPEYAGNSDAEAETAENDDTNNETEEDTQKDKKSDDKDEKHSGADRKKDKGSGKKRDKKHDDDDDNDDDEKDGDKRDKKEKRDEKRDDKKKAEKKRADDRDTEKRGRRLDDTPKKLSAIRATGAAFVAVLAVVFAVLLNYMFSARIGLSSDVLENAASSMNAGIILDSELPNGEIAAEYIYENLSPSFVSESGAQSKDLRSFLIKADSVGFASDVVKNYAAYLINGSVKDDPSVGSAEIIGFLRENEDVMLSEFGYVMEDSDYEAFGEFLGQEDVDDALSIKNWSYTVGFNLRNFHYILSFVSIGIIFALTAVLFIWTAIILDRHRKNIMGYFSTITLISGLAIFLPCLLFVVATAIIPATDGNYTTVYLASKLLMPFALIGGCTGLFELVLSFLFRRIRSVYRKRELKESSDSRS